MASSSNISITGLQKLCEKQVNEELLSPLITQHHHTRPDTLLMWSLGLAFVTLITISAAAGVLFMQCMSKSFFNEFITFFVAVGVGTLSGSSIFHLLPQAFGLVEEFNPNADHSYLWKSFAAVCGIYLFFIADKIIKVLLEARKRCKKEYELKAVPSCSESDHHTAEMNEITSQRSSEALTIRDALIKSVNLPNEDAEYEGHNNLDQAPSLCIHDHNMVYDTGSSVIGTVACMIIFGDGLHNFIDGVSIGASFSESILSGLSVSVAVICEEFPHELGDVAILVSAGMTLRQALIYNLLSAMTCYVGFVIGAIFGNLNEDFAAFIFAFAGGMFLYISIGCMMPEMKITMERGLAVSTKVAVRVLLLQSLGIFIGLSIMVVMARYSGEIQFVV